MADLSGVVVIAHLSDEKDPNSVTKSSSCSGILLSSFHAIVVTSSSVLSSLFKKTEETTKLKPSLTNRLGRLVGYGNGDVEKQNISLMNVNFSVIIDKNNEDLHVAVKHDAKFIAMVRCSSAIDEFENLMRDSWTPLPTDGLSREEIAQKMKNMTSFLFLQIQDGNYSGLPLPKNLSYNLKDVFVRCWEECGIPRKGDKISCESSLFGDLCPTVFMNSLSEGIIVNKFGSLFLIDARCMPGCEGGLVFQKLPNEKRVWIGIIVASLSWNKKEIIGLSVACSAVDILTEILRKFDVYPSKAIEFPVANEQKTTLLTRALSSVVIIKNGSMWGSGIVIDSTQKIIITCSHVIKDSDYVKVQIPYAQMRDYQAQVIYKTREGKALDVAVLVITENINFLTSVEIDTGKIKIGEEVLAAGFPVFPPFCQTGVHVTGGVVSKVVSSNGVPILIQTSCCVIGGSSGGLILGAKTGLGIGMVVCNAKDSKTNVSYPTVNLAVPLNTIYPILYLYLTTGDKTILNRLENNDNDIQRLWRLGKIEGMPDSKL